MKFFASDNNAGVHPKIMEALLRVNEGHTVGYGDDEHTRRAMAVVRDHFGQHCDPYFVFAGGGGNVVGLSAMLRPFEAVICTRQAHINVDECGAPERFIGCKLIDIPTEDGKLRPEMVADHMPHRDDVHQVQAKVISITNPTELGTVYTVEEVGALVEYARGYNMKVHVDGARLVNAAAYLNVPLSAITSDVGVDVVTFGGTKNGLMFGETVLVFDQEISKAVPFMRKQAGQLASKMRYIAAQVEAILTDNLWLDNADHANQSAKLLAQQLRAHPKVSITQVVQTNAVFATMPRETIERLLEQTFFYVWDEAKDEVRLMCSYDTTGGEVHEFGRLIAQSLT